MRYSKKQDGYEVDFVIKVGQKIAELIQVAWDVRGEAARRREERTLEENGKTIRYMPMWKWLLIPGNLQIPYIQ